LGNRAQATNGNDECNGEVSLHKIPFVEIRQDESFDIWTIVQVELTKEEGRSRGRFSQTIPVV
jgi:hypothetical protein